MSLRDLLSWLGGIFRPAPPPPLPPWLPPAPPPPAPGPERWRRDLLDRVNLARAQAFVPALSMSPDLNRAAQAQAARMAAEGRLFHGPDDEVVGEGQRSPAEIVSDWLASPGHRRALLDPRWRLAGWGRAEGHGRTWWVGDLS